MARIIQKRSSILFDGELFLADRLASFNSISFLYCDHQKNDTGE